MNKTKKIVILLILCLSIGAITFCLDNYKVTTYAYTDEEKAAAKAWLSANGYPPTMAGAEQAYQDYLNGKFGPVGEGDVPPEDNEPQEPAGSDSEKAAETQTQMQQGEESSEAMEPPSDNADTTSLSETEEADKIQKKNEKEEKKQIEEAEKAKLKEEEKQAEKAKMEEEEKLAEKAKMKEKEKPAEKDKKEAEQRKLQETEDNVVEEFSSLEADSVEEAGQMSDTQVEEDRKKNMFSLWIALPASAAVICSIIYVRRKKGAESSSLIS